MSDIKTSDDLQMDKVFEVFTRRLADCLEEGVTATDAAKSALKCAIAYNILSSESITSLVEIAKGIANDQ